MFNLSKFLLTESHVYFHLVLGKHFLLSFGEVIGFIGLFLHICHFHFYTL